MKTRTLTKTLANKAQIERWLDAQALALNDPGLLLGMENQYGRKETPVYLENICSIKYVQLYDTIETIAQILGIPVEKRLHGTGEYAELYFMYRGIKVMQLMEKEEEEPNETD